MILTAQCLDNWLEDFEQFRHDFLLFCYRISKAVGYYFEFDQSSLYKAHNEWNDICREWANADENADSNELSHLKIVSILAIVLSNSEWIKELSEFDPQDEPRGYHFVGTQQEKEKIRMDINAARGAYFALQFCTQVLNWFETARIDRVQRFEFRMTEGLEHDVLVHLVSSRRNVDAMFLMFKALYARDFKQDN
ncbi:MAG: hypothetical protein ACLPN5_01750 [Roseiarcus sp.]